jgi:hypothetical protein
MRMQRRSSPQTERKTGNDWGVPDWRDASAYPKPDEISNQLWRWEFIRRMPDYRAAWDKASGVQYEIECRRATDSKRELTRIKKPDDLYFTVSSAAYSFPEEFNDLLKYGIHPIYNPRLRVPRPFKDGPSIIQYADERGGYFCSTPKPTDRQEPVSILAGWTAIHFDLTVPLNPQVARARTRLEQLQIAFAEENDFVDKLRINTSRRARRTLWPFYLRVLDARNEGMTFEQIGLTLGRYEDRDQAKKDAHKWHEAGSRIATATIWD